MIKEFKCTINDEYIYTKAYYPDTNKKYPAVIMCHGFCVTHLYFEYYAKELLKHDIASILFDFRGGIESNKSSGDFFTTSVLTEIDDLNTVVEKVLQLNFVDKNNLYILGHSQGAFVSAIVASHTPSLIKSLFLLAPAFLIPEQMREITPPEKNQLKDNIVGVISRKYVIDASKINIWDEISGYKRPVYIYHGTKDNAVDISYSKHALKVYSNANLIILNNQRHNFKKEAKQVVLNDLIKIIGRELND